MSASLAITILRAHSAQDSYVARPDGKAVWFDQKGWTKAGVSSGEEKVHAGHFEKML
jgi:hypothetical protein